MSSNKKVSLPQPDAPQQSASPLDALAPNPYCEPSLLDKYGYTFLGGLVGGLTVFAHNYFSKRPAIAGIHRYPFAIVAGGALIFTFQKYKEDQWAQRDAIFRHYISLHPEDFPPYQRVKIGDLFDDWTPVR